MPAYDYKCKSCEEVFEIKRSSTDDTTVTCPVCQGETRRVFSPVGVVFKGSGFHNTDYKNKPDAGGELAKKPKEIADSSTTAAASSSDAPSSAAPCAASKSDGGACATCPAAKE